MGRTRFGDVRLGAIDRSDVHGIRPIGSSVLADGLLRHRLFFRWGLFAVEEAGICRRKGCERELPVQETCLGRAPGVESYRCDLGSQRFVDQAR